MENELAGMFWNVGEIKRNTRSGNNDATTSFSQTDMVFAIANEPPQNTADAGRNWEGERMRPCLRYSS